MKPIFLSLGAALAVLTAATVAHASGSIAFTDILERFENGGAAERKAVEAKTASLGIKVEDIVCAGTRLGKQWAQLSGARHGPYECKAGDTFFFVDTKVSFLDKSGSAITDEAAQPAKAAKIIEAFVEFTWP